VVPLRPGLLVSPADGRIQAIETVPPLAELDMGDQPLCRVSIFLDVFDVHVNRVAAEGVVARLTYRPGKFLNAALDKASEENERQSVAIDLEDGRRIGMVQIAGLVARRIVCQLKEGQRVERGERFGLIRFGSRTDLFLPPGAQPLVAVGQRAVGGETVICDLASDEPQRLGEVR
jgi:phosphatidylserine decarboxylase